MTAEITKAILLPSTLALSPPLFNHCSAWPTGKGLCQRACEATSSHLACHPHASQNYSSWSKVLRLFIPSLLQGRCWGGLWAFTGGTKGKPSELEPAVKHQQSALFLVPDYALSCIAKHIFFFFFFCNCSSEVQSHCYSDTMWLLFSLPVLIMCPPLLLLQAGGL